MPSSRVVLAGGSGFIGQALARDLISRGFEVVVLTRSVRGSLVGAPLAWDGSTVGPWAEALDGALAVVNLTGKSIYAGGTEAGRREIVRSRVDSVRAVAEAIRRCQKPPACFVQTSAAGYYGDAGDRVCDESSPPGTGFLAETCAAWEEVFDREPTPGVRRVILRLGVVLGRQGGALPILARLTRWFLGGAVGRGRHWVSWIHVDDVARVVAEAIFHEQFSGIYNATAPGPVRNAELMAELRRVLGRPWSPPAPVWAVRLGAALVGMDPSVATTGQRAVPRRLLDAGFEFAFSELRAATRDLIVAALPAVARNPG